MVLLAQSWSLIYQFGLHTERIGTLPRPLEAVLTAEYWNDRLLGSNQTTGNLPLDLTFFATGNNLVLGGDMTRRAA